MKRVVTIELDDRDREIIQLCAEGYNSRTIGRALNMSSRTVEAYICSIKQYLGATTIAHMVYLALKKKIIE